MDIPLHLLYCPPGTPYFDHPGTADGEEEFTVGGMPEDWHRSTDPEWTHLEAPGQRLPDQGWKIHVSATPANAPHVLRTVADHCVRHGLTFKHLRGPEQLFRRNWKYAARSESGKFITVYPSDDDQLAEVLTTLGDLLEGEEGPYILSDVRWRGGPLYVRYGAFRKIEQRRADGSTVYCIVNPEGNLEPDVRRPGFHPPAWAVPPPVLGEALEARLAGTLRDFPYAVERPLHYSNGGGVYRGTDTRDGATVLLREARPHAGLDLAGRDAVARLVRERDALEALRDVDVVPRLVEHRRGHEHHYLVREFVDGVPWGRWVLEHHPLAGPTGMPHDAYLRTLTTLVTELAEGLGQMHERGVVFADLHPNNVLVTPDLHPRVIDLEMAREPGSTEDQTLGAPGFTAPSGVHGTAIDEHALGSLLLWSMVPVTGPLGRGPEMIATYLAVAEEWFPEAADLRHRVTELVRVLATDGTVQRFGSLAQPGRADGAPQEWPRGLASATLRSADVSRHDRLYPGDARQLSPVEGGVGLAYGAAGVLWALAECGHEVPGEHVDWLWTRAGIQGDGLFSGSAGVALALAALGREDQALTLIGPAVQRAVEVRDETVWRGAAGVGLAALHLADVLGEDRLRDAGIGIARALATTAAGRADGTPQRPGLTHGVAGTALLLLRALDGGAADLLDPATRLLHAELDTHPALRPGAVPTAPEAYGLGQGIAGLVLVAAQLLHHRADERAGELCELAPALLDRPLHPEAGLLHGRAGLALGLAAAGAPDDQVRRQLRRLDLHAVRHLEGWAVLGEQGLRVSTDLATGSAGVLLAEHALASGRPALPFLTGTASAVPAATAVTGSW